MGHFPFLTFLLTFLSLTNLRQIDGQTTTCRNNYEYVAYQNIKERYVGASNICNRIRGSLAKIDSLDTAKKFGEITIQKPYYIGLKKLGGTWKWSDNSPLGGYQNWKNNEHNNTNKNCVVIHINAIYQWEGVSCSDFHGYICQKATTIDSVTVRPFSTDISSDNGVNEIKCTASKTTSCSVLVVEWYGPDSKPSPVSTLSSAKVYQVKSNGPASTSVSKLVLKDPQLSNDGRYVCRATTASSSRDSPATVIVQGTPTILRIDNEKCSSNLTVFWKPNRRAVSFMHIIKVYLNTTNIVVKSIKALALNSQEYNTTISGLDHSTNYTIKISACKTDACAHGYPDIMKATTGGIPQKVNSVQIIHQNDVCSLTWYRPLTVRDKIIQYIIISKKLIYKTRNNNTNNYFNASFHLLNSTYTFTVQANYEYTLQVQAVTCGGAGEPVIAKGICVGAAEAPKNVSKPTVVQSMDETYVTVNIPDETHGLMSCLFIIISNVSLVNEEDRFSSIFTLQQLMDANNSKLNDEFIARALPVYRFANIITIKLKLGDKSKSYCNISNTGTFLLEDNMSRVADEEVTFVGKNKPLRQNQSYRVYIVAVVPHERSFLMTRSPSATIKSHEPGVVNFMTSQPATDIEISRSYVMTTVSSKKFEFDVKLFGIGLAFPVTLIIGFAAGILYQKRHFKTAKTLEEDISSKHHHPTLEEKCLSNTTPEIQHKIKNINCELDNAQHHYAEIPEYSNVTSAKASDSAYETYEA